MPPSKFCVRLHCARSGRGEKTYSQSVQHPQKMGPAISVAIWIATEIAGPAIGHFERNGRKKFGEPRKIGLLQNGPGHWRPKPWGQHLGTRAQPGGMSSRPRGPLPSNARGEKSALFFRAFFRVSGKQFRTLADRWRFSAIGHAGPASCKVSAGAYQFCAATLCRV